MNVTWVPPGTVMFCGQTALFEIVMVVDVELAVHVPPVDGPLALLLQPAESAAIAAASTAVAARRDVWNIPSFLPLFHS